MACLLNVDEMIPAKHPIRSIKTILNTVLREMDGQFEEMYGATGRPSIPPERLLLSKVLMALYSIRSERQFCERLQYDLLFRWFLDVNPDEPGFDHSTFSQNQERLLHHQVADHFFAQVVWFAKAKRWVSDQHFSADGTLIESWASLKSVEAKEEKDDPATAGTATVGSILRASSAATRRTNRRPIRRPSWRARAMDGKRSYASPAMR